MIGEPRQRIVGVAEHVARRCRPAGTFAVDDGSAGHVQQIRRRGPRAALAEHAAGSRKRIIGHQCGLEKV